MLNTNKLQAHTGGSLSSLMALAARMPRILAVTATVMFASFAAVQFLPQTFEASLQLPIAEPHAVVLDDPLILGDVVSRLPQDVIAELRESGGDTQDTTLLLRSKLEVANTETGVSLVARAGTAARARAIVEAAAEGLAASAPLPPPLQSGSDGKTNSAAADSGTSVTELQKQLSVAWEDRVRLENRAKRIEALVSNKNYAMLALDAEDLPNLSRQLSLLSEATAERERLAVDLLPNHPKMRTVENEISGLSRELSGELERLSKLVVAERDAARRLEDNLRDRIATASLAPAEVSTGDEISTGSTNGYKASVTALPRPIRTDVTLTIAGGLALLAQIGFFALRRPAPGIEGTAIAGSLARAPADAEPIPVEPAIEDEATPATDLHNVEDLLADLDRARFVIVESRGAIGSATRKLLAHYQAQDLSVVLVDACSGKLGHAPGLSDLSLGFASFAEIVHGSGRERTALVPWGSRQALNLSARPVGILFNALTELYDVVIVCAGEDQTRELERLCDGADLLIDAELIEPLFAKAA